MKYNNIHEGVFNIRPNRFIANVTIYGKEETCHVKNTGRCKELLLPGTKVFLEKSGNEERKTKYDLVAVMKNGNCINIDSTAPNKAVHEWLQGGGLFGKADFIKPESTYKNSRFDFYIEAKGRQIFAEVKGVTLENDTVAMFPDAPTERGVKHLKELIECKKEGFDAYIIFVLQMKGVKYFTPNVKTDPNFAKTLKECSENGVNVVCVECVVTPDSMVIDENVKVVL